ncbi:MAG: beta-carotene hydroxylase [Myxococcota bacterium]
MLITLFTALAATVLMEPWAAFVHKVVWHGPLWTVHVTHHTPRQGLFEWNDIFPLLHAPPAIAMLAWGFWGPPGLITQILLGLGIGISVYGMAYQFVHDFIVHRRLPLRFLEKIPYIAQVRRAHLTHHGRGGAPWGLFLGPWERKERSPSLKLDRES